MPPTAAAHYEIFDANNISQACVEQLRNVCILAHVDHGKTTLSDHLISANGLISARSAGHLRYLDSRSDEQTRLITMKSSCITLSYRPSQIDPTYWVNLIDSPGHVDFSSEVSAAARLCDGALLLVDAVEGVCPQTRQVMFRAFAERLKLLLVINKMDRLFSELKLSAQEIYFHINGILTEANTVMQQLLVEEAMQTAQHALIRNESSSNTREGNQSFTIDDRLEESVRFSPEKGNVVFCSSVDGWAFDLPVFAKTLAIKMKLPPAGIPKLVRALWGDYYIQPKTLAISRKPFLPNSSPMAVQLVFEQLSKAYKAASAETYDEKAVSKLIENLNLKISQHIYTSRTEALRGVMSAWLPLAQNLLSTVVDILPSPLSCAEYRLTHLCPDYAEILRLTETEVGKEKYKVIKSLRNCGRTPNDETVVYVAKFLSADLQNLRLTGDKLSGTERMSDFVALGRIFCGMLCPQMSLYIGGTEFSQQRSVSTKKAQVVIKNIYFLLGRDLVPTTTAGAGSVVAVALQSISSDDGEPETMNDVLAWVMSLTNSYAREQQEAQKLHTRLGEQRRDISLCSIDRCITLSSSIECPVFRTPYSETSSAIVRVCVEPMDVRDLSSVLKGLATLYKADPGVEVDVLLTGEVTLGCSGEVHLEKCINDLQNLYARVPLKVSPPLVAVRESFVSSKTLPLGPISSLPFPPWATTTEQQQQQQQQHLSGIPKIALSVNNIKEDTMTIDTGLPITVSPQNPLTTKATYTNAYNNNLINKRGEPVIGSTSNGLYTFSVHAIPLPGRVLQWLDEYATELESVFSYGKPSSVLISLMNTTNNETQLEDYHHYHSTHSELYTKTLMAIDSYITALWTHDDHQNTIITNISGYEPSTTTTTSGTKRIIPPSDSYLGCNNISNNNNNIPSGKLVLPGTLFGIATGKGARNILFWSDPANVCELDGQQRSFIIDSAMRVAYAPSGRRDIDVLQKDSEIRSCNLPKSYIPDELLHLMPAIASGFNLASQSGPLCEEPVIGVGFVIRPLVIPSPSESISKEAVVIIENEKAASSSISQPYGPASGQVMSCIKDCCRKALIQRGCTRIYEAMLRLELHCEQEFLGRAYGVLAKRRAQIISEELREGTSLFAVEAFLPVIDSLGLAIDLRSRASGQVSMHLQFSHWQMLEEDPFPEASMTEEELEDEGESGFLMFPSNVARRIIYTMRKRKGLPTDEKIVDVATKQRTLTRNK